MKTFGLLAIVMTIGAAPPGSYPVRGDTGHPCGVGKTRVLIGRQRSPAVEREALHLSGAGIVRWVPPGTMVTMDYRPDRLNLHVDRRGRILKVNCG